MEAAAKTNEARGQEEYFAYVINYYKAKLSFFKAVEAAFKAPKITDPENLTPE